jgi:hypothetical protein
MLLLTNFFSTVSCSLDHVRRPKTWLTLCLMTLFVVPNLHAAVVAEFDVSGQQIGTPGATTNAVGSAVLDDTGTLSIATIADIFFDGGALGNASVKLEFNQTFSGTLVGANFSGVAITEHTQLSCVDTGSTGIFGCGAVNVADTFDVLNQPIIFDFSLDGSTVIDWLSGSTTSPATLPLDPNNGFSRYTLTTIPPSAVPLPAAVWLLGSCMLGLAGQIYKTPKNGVKPSFFASRSRH